ncbi:hypothetical protein ACHAQI_004228 [Fusarium lateritium]
MPARLPNLAHLMALLEKFLAPLGPGLPGGTMTNAEIERQEKGSLVKGEPATDEAWDAAVAAAAAASPPPSSLSSSHHASSQETSRSQWP